MSILSIVITTYNSERFIIDTLNSVINQTFQDFEIIIVDDSSTDSTRKLVKKYIDRNHHVNIKFFKTEENSKACKAEEYWNQE